MEMLTFNIATAGCNGCSKHSNRSFNSSSHSRINGAHLKQMAQSKHRTKVKDPNIVQIVVFVVVVNNFYGVYQNARYQHTNITNSKRSEIKVVWISHFRSYVNDNSCQTAEYSIETNNGRENNQYCKFHLKIISM